MSKETKKPEKEQVTENTQLPVVIEKQEFKITKRRPIKIEEIPLDLIVANSENPRKFTDDDSELSGLVNDLEKNGLINPITVRKIQDSDKYQLIAGERRFRACKALEYKTISCNVQDYDDEQALDIMMSENLIRQDLKPIDEARKYQSLIWDKQYTIADIAIRFGQLKQHIYNRLALLNMIPEITELLESDEITLGIANEISKYPKEIQESVYVNHLTDSYYSWKNDSLKAFKEKISKNYSTLLSQFPFDKKDCTTCNFNSECMSMFPNADLSHCQKRTCLDKKQNEYVMSKTLELIQLNPEADINISPAASCDENVNNQLSELGLKVTNEHCRDLPLKPLKPERKDFKKGVDHKKAIKIFKQEEKIYSSDMARINQAIAEGKSKMAIDISEREPTIRVVNVSMSKNNELTSAEKENKSAIDKLNAKDDQNKKCRTNNIIRDNIEFLRASETKTEVTNDLEMSMLYYILLGYVRRQTYESLGVAEKHYLDEKTKMEIAEKLSTPQKHLIIRDYIINYVTQHGYSSAGEGMLKEFMELHFPEELQAIDKKYSDVYNQRHKNIQAKLKLLKPKKVGKGNKVKDAVVQEQETQKQIVALSDESVSSVITAKEEEEKIVIEQVDYIDVDSNEHMISDIEESENNIDNDIHIVEEEEKDGIESIDYVREFSLKDNIEHDKHPFNIPVHDIVNFPRIQAI